MFVGLKLIQILLVNDRYHRATTHGTGLAPLATGMTGVVVTTRIEYRLLDGIEANQTLLLFCVLIDTNLRWWGFGNVRFLDDGDVFGILDTIIVLVSGRHKFDGCRFDTEMTPLHTEVAGELAVRGGQVAWGRDAYTEFATFFDAGEVDIGDVWVLLLLWVR
jgi:hypothetical protein